MNFTDFMKKETDDLFMKALELKETTTPKQRTVMVANKELSKDMYEMVTSASNTNHFYKECAKKVEKKYRKYDRRITAKVGEILSVKPHGSNSWLVKGTEGTCHVEVIEAGGYNIQARHYRVLIK